MEPGQIKINSINMSVECATCKTEVEYLYQLNPTLIEKARVEIIKAHLNFIDQLTKLKWKCGYMQIGAIWYCPKCIKEEIKKRAAKKK